MARSIERYAICDARHTTFAENYRKRRERERERKLIGKFIGSDYINCKKIERRVHNCVRCSLLDGYIYAPWRLITQMSCLIWPNQRQRQRRRWQILKSRTHFNLRRVNVTIWWWRAFILASPVQRTNRIEWVSYEVCVWVIHVLFRRQWKRERERNAQKTSVWRCFGSATAIFVQRIF